MCRYTRAVATIRLFHWHEGEAVERAARLEALGHRVDASPLPDAAALRALRAAPPDAFVVDLSRLPSHGREIGVALRQARATRLVPLVFVGGAADKVARVREVLPDAVFTTWEAVARDLDRALAAPPERVVSPRSLMDAYAGTPLPRKLGVKEGSTVVLVAPPAGFEATLGELPAGATLTRDAAAPRQVTLWFVRRRSELEARLAEVAAPIGRGLLWVAWPKKASGLAADLDQQLVREAGLALGLVDSKIAAVDATWSALRFTWRR